MTSDIGIAAALDCDRMAALRVTAVSRETERRLAVFVDILARWRKSINLISEATFPSIWSRHVADSLQLIDLAPSAKRWVDLGSGAGFPGLVVAIALADSAGALVHCIEADRRKAAFLREAARETGAPAQIHACRVETLDVEALEPVDAVTSRAMAPLSQLIQFARLWLEHDAVGVFPRGRTADAQLEGLRIPADFALERLPSRVDPSAVIVRVRKPQKAAL